MPVIWCRLRYGRTSHRCSGCSTNSGSVSPDVVKRSTAGGSDLRAADFRQWAPVLKEQIVHICPLVAWFHGKQAYGGYLRHAEACREPAPGWGLQERTIGNTRVFVSPNPSPANAAYSLSDLIESYRALKACMEVS